MLPVCFTYGHFGRVIFLYMEITDLKPANQNFLFFYKIKISLYFYTWKAIPPPAAGSFTFSSFTNAK